MYLQMLARVDYTEVKAMLSRSCGKDYSSHAEQNNDDVCKMLTMLTANAGHLRSPHSSWLVLKRLVHWLARSRYRYQLCFRTDYFLPQWRGEVVGLDYQPHVFEARLADDWWAKRKTMAIVKPAIFDVFKRAYKL